RSRSGARTILRSLRCYADKTASDLRNGGEALLEVAKSQWPGVAERGSSVACVIRASSDSRLYQAVTADARASGFHLFDAVCADGQHAGVEPLDPALLPQIPDVKIQVLGGTADDTCELHLAHARLTCAPPALNVQQSEQPFPDVCVVDDRLAVGGLGRDLPGAVPVLLVLRVVGRPRLGVAQRAERFNEEIEAFCIAVGDVGMILLGQVAKHTVDRVLVRVRTELKEFVVVDEQLSAHVPTPEIVVGRIGPELEPSTGGTSYHTVPGIVSANGQAHRIPVIRP